MAIRQHQRWQQDEAHCRRRYEAGQDDRRHRALNLGTGTTRRQGQRRQAQSGDERMTRIGVSRSRAPRTTVANSQG